jgi:hypothetical protein
MPTADSPEFVYVFDANRRVYANGSDGRATGAPIYREHWRKCKVVGQTSRSWILDGWPNKTLKANAKTATEVDADCWLHANVYRISDMILRCRDPATLRAVAEIIGWKETE